MKDTQMETDMKEIFIKAKLMVKEFIIGLMEKNMMESGKMESKMDTECGEVFSATPILVNGKTLKQMVMEFISGKMVIGMKAPGSTA